MAVPVIDPKTLPPGSKVVRFIGQGIGHQIVCTEAKAKDYLSKFKMKSCDFFTDDENTWALRAANITTIEVIDYSTLVERQRIQEQEAAMQGVPTFNLGKKSGVA